MPPAGVLPLRSSPLRPQLPSSLPPTGPPNEDTSNVTAVRVPLLPLSRTHQAGAILDSIMELTKADFYAARRARLTGNPEPKEEKKGGKKDAKKDAKGGKGGDRPASSGHAEDRRTGRRLQDAARGPRGDGPGPPDAF